jgi:hypothetical protein
VLSDQVNEQPVVKTKEMARRLELANWLAAWDRYSLAAAMLDQLTFVQTVQHKIVVTEVAALAHSEARLPLLGVLYDEISRCVVFHGHARVCSRLVCVRKHWEELSGKLGSEFDVGKLIASVQDDALRQARALHDTLFQKTATPPHGSKQGEVVSKARIPSFCGCALYRFAGWRLQASSWKPETGSHKRKWEDHGAWPSSGSWNSGRYSGYQGNSNGGKQAKSDAKAKCFNCQEIGHRAANCPRSAVKK